jgi:hypothetical protein
MRLSFLKEVLGLHEQISLLPQGEEERGILDQEVEAETLVEEEMVALGLRMTLG